MSACWTIASAALQMDSYCWCFCLRSSEAPMCCCDASMAVSSRARSSAELCSSPCNHFRVHLLVEVSEIMRHERRQLQLAGFRCRLFAWTAARLSMTMASWQRRSSARDLAAAMSASMASVALRASAAAASAVVMRCSSAAFSACVCACTTKLQRQGRAMSNSHCYCSKCGTFVNQLMFAVAPRTWASASCACSCCLPSSACCSLDSSCSARRCAAAAALVAARLAPSRAAGTCAAALVARCAAACAACCASAVRASATQAAC
jgi:hypothetical protein